MELIKTTHIIKCEISQFVDTWLIGLIKTTHIIKCEISQFVDTWLPIQMNQRGPIEILSDALGDQPSTSRGVVEVCHGHSATMLEGHVNAYRAPPTPTPPHITTTPTPPHHLHSPTTETLYQRRCITKKRQLLFGPM